MKKFLSVLLCAVLLAALTAPCSLAEEVPHISLSVLTYGIENLTETPKYHDQVLAAVNEKLAAELGFTIDVSYVSYTNEDLKTKMSLDLAAGAKYDLIRGGESSELFKNGLLMDLTDLIDEYAPNYKANIPQSVWDEVSVDGHIWAMPTTGFAIIYSPWIRGEWLTAAGLELPGSIEEFETVMEAFRDGDFDQNGVDDTVPYATPFYKCEQFLLGQFTSTPGDFADEEGQVHPKFDAEGYVDFLAKLRDWYEKKYVDDQLFAGDDNTVSNLYVQGITGIVGLHVHHLQWGPIGAADRENPDMNTRWLPHFDETELAYPSSGSVSSYVMISPYSENAKYAIQFLDWYMFNEENYYLCHKGIEGLTYNIVDGALEVPEAEGDATLFQLIGLIAPETRSAMEFKYFGADTPKESVIAYTYCVSGVDLAKVFVPVTATLNPVIDDLALMEKQDADVAAMEVIQGIVTGERPLSDFDAMLEDYHSQTQEYYQIMTEAYQAK